MAADADRYWPDRAASIANPGRMGRKKAPPPPRKPPSTWASSTGWAMDCTWLRLTSQVPRPIGDLLDWASASAAHPLVKSASAITSLSPSTRFLMGMDAWGGSFRRPTDADGQGLEMALAFGGGDAIIRALRVGSLGTRQIEVPNRRRFVNALSHRPMKWNRPPVRGASAPAGHSYAVCVSGLIWKPLNYQFKRRDMRSASREFHVACFRSHFLTGS